MTYNSEREALLVEARQSDTIVLRIAASMASLVIFDTCISFAEELELVWKQKWSFGKSLYLYIRYISLGLTIAGFYATLYVNPSIKRCRTLTQVYMGFVASFTLAIKFTQLLRTAALYNGCLNEKRVLVLLSAVAFVVLFGLSVLLVLSYETIRYPFPGVSCALLPTFPRPIYLTFYAFAILPDVASCAACVVKIFRLWSGGNSKLATIMVRDSLSYMLILTLLAVPQCLTPLFLPENSTIIVTGLNFVIIAISGVACCRMMLNIRSFCLVQQERNLATMSMTMLSTSTVSGIEFS